jgi:nicotinic acid mononucleotide adenylyltransferase
MDLVHRGARDASRVAMLPAAWNPPTLAHLALAEAALHFADEVLLVLPRVFPHKGFEHAGFDLRLEWLRRIAAGRPGLGVGVTEGGLFLEMARALRTADARIERVYIVCGHDAAERFLNWPYERGPGAVEQLREFSLLVAPRGKDFEPPDSLRGSIHTLSLDPKLYGISSTEVRQRIGRGEAWTHLVPDEIAGELGSIYR